MGGQMWKKKKKMDQGFLFTQISGHGPIKILKVQNISKLQDFSIYWWYAGNVFPGFIARPPHQPPVILSGLTLHVSGGNIWAFTELYLVLSYEMKIFRMQVV